MDSMDEGSFKNIRSSENVPEVRWMEWSETLENLQIDDFNNFDTVFRVWSLVKSCKSKESHGQNKIK